MISFSFLLITIIFLGVVFCDDLFGMRLTTEKTKTREKAQYLFRYHVKDDTTGDYKTQEEIKKGDSVQGSYSVADPNGDLRTVTYKAGPGRGFEATVDVQPKGSLKKQTYEIATTRIQTTLPIKHSIKTNESTKTENPITMESKIKHFPGGFVMDILSKPQTEIKTEVGMKFSMGSINETEVVTDLINTNSVPFSDGRTEKLETIAISEEPVHTTSGQFTIENTPTLAMENFTFSEGREISESREIEKEINEAIIPMPKLPELVLSDNITHLKFNKDPEEALLDERITQIARQLAETSLRREYEERKLGHFIPISIRPIEHSTSHYLSKSFKFTENNIPFIRPSESDPLHVLTQVKVVPQYIYKETVIPNLLPLHHRLPVISREILKTELLKEPTFSTIIDEAETPNINKSEKFIKEINKIQKTKNPNYHRTYPTPIPTMTIPTFFQFFSPIQRYVINTQKPFQRENSANLYINKLNEDLTRAAISRNDGTFYSHISKANDLSTEKS